MANRTVKDAHTIKGTNPQYLIEKIVRTRIYESKYWKEECFALSGKFMFPFRVLLLRRNFLTHNARNSTSARLTLTTLTMMKDRHSCASGVPIVGLRIALYKCPPISYAV